MGRKRGKGRTARKNPAQNKDEPDEIKKAPHTFVIYRGKVGRYVAELMKNFRKVMEPYTAAKLRVLKSNVLKDFVAIASAVNVTHMVIFTKSELSNYMRIIRFPRGPTLTFRINEYSLSSDVVSSLKRPVSYAKQFEHHPLLVLNNFSGEGFHLKLMATTFQNMFPSINVNTVNLNSMRRCALLNYNSDGTIDFRHYTIKVVPTGMSKAVKKLVQSKVPNLSARKDISDYLLKPGNLSESEVEQDGAHNQVILPQNISSRGNMKAQQSAIRLTELGPRLKLTLVKIEEGLMEGETLYHSQISKTPEEIEAIRLQRRKREKEKEKRKQQQHENIMKKKKVKFSEDKPASEKRKQPKQFLRTAKKRRVT